MNYPTFFDVAPRIVVHDYLADFLGAFNDGIITYRYIDAVRLAGHSCPTVATAYLMTRRALALLYPETMPERGAVQVQFSASFDEGVIGVISSVVSLITGAAGTGGFKGIGRQFKRQNLMQFANSNDDDDGGDEACFTRNDNGTSVRLKVQLGRVVANPRSMTLLRKCLENLASTDEVQEFATLWQERVKRILIDHADDPELFAVVQ
jgi:hypothetical protein